MDISLSHGDRTVSSRGGDSRKRDSFCVRESRQGRMSHDIRNEGSRKSLEGLRVPVPDSFPIDVTSWIRGRKDPVRLRASRNLIPECGDGRIRESDLPGLLSSSDVDLLLREMNVSMSQSNKIRDSESCLVSQDHNRPPGFTSFLKINRLHPWIRHLRPEESPESLFMPVDDPFLGDVTCRIFLGRKDPSLLRRSDLVKMCRQRLVNWTCHRKSPSSCQTLSSSDMNLK